MSLPVSALAGLPDGSMTTLTGMAAVVVDNTTKQRRPWADVVLETEGGDARVFVYPNVYASLAEVALRAGTRWRITGRVDLRDDDEPRLIATAVEPLT